MEGLSEEPIVFDCQGERLYGLLTYPIEPSVGTGILIVVGGPQYRVGSHRQFVVLARGLAKSGIPVFRFDCRGMGDSTGDFPGFEELDDDIRSAMDAFKRNAPEVHKFVIWGLCDGASAAGFYAHTDGRVKGLCMVNPWVRTEQGEAETLLKHYYFSRLVSRDFWAKVFSGRLRFTNTLKDFFELMQRSVIGVKRKAGNCDEERLNTHQLSLPDRLFRDMESYMGKVMIVISGNDLTAAEFVDSIGKDRKRRKLIKSSRVTMVDVPKADHTFSRREWMTELVNQTSAWVRGL